MRLPFNLKTETNTYQYEAFVSGILFAKNRKHWPYFLSNYIRIVHYFNSGTVLNYYADNPLLLNDGLIQDELAILPMVCAERGADIAAIAVNALENGKYVFGLYNEELVPEKRSYKVNYFVHDYLLYGYEGDAFISAAYLKDQHYREFRLKMEDYNRAVFTQEANVYLHLFSYNEESSLGFDFEKVIKDTRAYLNSQKFTDDETIYGLDAIKFFAKEIGEDEIDLDVRSVCFLKEHKNLMRMRLEYMRDNGYISLSHDVAEQYAEMAKRLHQGVMLAIKYNITHDKHILERLAQTLRESAEQDERVLGDILARL